MRLKYPAACHVRPNLDLPSVAEVLMHTHLFTILPYRSLRKSNYRKAWYLSSVGTSGFGLYVVSGIQHMHGSYVYLNRQE